jgi:hypothetical protein
MSWLASQSAAWYPPKRCVVVFVPWCGSPCSLSVALSSHLPDVLEHTHHLSNTLQAAKIFGYLGDHVMLLTRMNLRDYLMLKPLLEGTSGAGSSLVSAAFLTFICRILHTSSISVFFRNMQKNACTTLLLHQAMRLQSIFYHRVYTNRNETARVEVCCRPNFPH